VPRPLIDLLWREHADAQHGQRRGPTPRHSTGDVINHAVKLADTGGLGAVTVRALADSLNIKTMSVYTHVNSREDLLVLMADEVHTRMKMSAFGRSNWRTRVRRIADANLALLRTHSWMLEIEDPRIALGPGTIAKYDRELHAFDETGLDDLARDAALTFVLDFARASAARLASTPRGDFSEVWAESVGPLANYLGDEYPLAQRVGQIAGENLGGPYDASRAWGWGLDRVLSGLAELIEQNSAGDR